MIKIEKNKDLKNLNTFGVPARAKFFAEVSNEEELQELWAMPEFKNNPKLFLGGGSNILFTKDWGGIVVLSKIKGIEVLEDTADYAIVRAMGGEVWHDLVEFAVTRDLWGIENLASIPGSAGAAPMQNIGAYGASLKSVLHAVEAYDVNTGEKKVFTNDMYSTGYRESIFKNEFKGRYFITAIILKLSKIKNLNTKYRSLEDYLEKNRVEVKGPADVSRAVTEIRKEKLPSPSVIPNAGSFFKNILVSKEKFEEFARRFPDMPYFKEGDMIKIPSGWLIETAGFKGHRSGDVGVYAKHALVLVNHGQATGQEIQEFAQTVQEAVYKKFGLKLEPEVNFI